MEQAYIQGFKANVDAFRRLFEQLGEDKSLPLLFHCSAGKDRTGVMTALLLTLLGVDRQTVIDDYLLSAKVWNDANLVAIESLLTEVESQGGIEAFLSKIGVPADLQTKIRNRLLE